MLEKNIEQKVCLYAEKKYGILTYKQSVMGCRNRPDRMFLVPGGSVFFIEFKQLGEKETRGQLHEHDKLRGLGFAVYVCDSAEAGRKIIDAWGEVRRIS